MPSGPARTRRLDADGAYRPEASRFAGRVTADGSSPYPVATGRYELIVDPSFPRSHAIVVTRRLLGLEKAIDLSPEPAGLPALYRETDPAYTGAATAPALYDRLTRQIVSNDDTRIILDLATQWRGLHRAGAPDLYPRPLRAHFDALDALAGTDVAEGVYRCGLAGTQRAYDDAYRRLFDRLDWFAMMLTQRRYVLGDRLTAADVRLFTVLVRFDLVYHGLFRCNRGKLTELPVLWDYARDLYQTEGFGDTVDFERIKRDHYAAFGDLAGTTGETIVPGGPDLSGWTVPHTRAAVTAPG